MYVCTYSNNETVDHFGEDSDETRPSSQQAVKHHPHYQLSVSNSVKCIGQKKDRHGGEFVNSPVSFIYADSPDSDGTGEDSLIVTTTRSPRRPPTHYLFHTDAVKSPLAVINSNLKKFSSSSLSSKYVKGVLVKNAVVTEKNLSLSHANKQSVTGDVRVQQSVTGDVRVQQSVTGDVRAHALTEYNSAVLRLVEISESMESVDINTGETGYNLGEAVDDGGYVKQMWGNDILHVSGDVKETGGDDCVEEDDEFVDDVDLFDVKRLEMRKYR
jgi:hypothetical protein